ncbi:MAG: hypothetical protein AAF986_11215 [Pseudomonadota bacterium]
MMKLPEVLNLAASFAGGVLAGALLGWVLLGYFPGEYQWAFLLSFSIGALVNVWILWVLKEHQKNTARRKKHYDKLCDYMSKGNLPEIDPSEWDLSRVTDLSHLGRTRREDDTF